MMLKNVLTLALFCCLMLGCTKPEPKTELPVEIGFINDPDRDGVSIKTKELLLQESIESVIKDFRVYVEKDKAAKAVILIRNDEFLRSKQIYTTSEYMQEHLVNIAVILDPDLPGVARKLYQFLLKEGIESFIEGSVVYGVEVDKDQAERAIELIRNDEYWGNTKEIEIDAKYIKVDSGEK